MLILRGYPAFSQFRHQQMLVKLQQIIPAVAWVTAEFQHYIKIKAGGEKSFNKEKSGILTRLLTYGPSTQPQQKGIEGLACQTEFLVVPRPGTISPWSSKATDIAHNCGLDMIHRIERGVQFTVFSDEPFSEACRVQMAHTLHDRMTQAVFRDASEISQLFIEFEPMPMTTVDILKKGRPSLVEANHLFGMSLSDEEIDYLLHRYQKFKRNPTDVELMMFAQANSEHCRHKIFNATWRIEGEDQELSLFQMIRNTHACNSEGVLSAYKDNAAVIKGPYSQRFYPDSVSRIYAFNEEAVHILMKVETHNHPTAIAPYSGSATGAGGEIRDEGATGVGAKPKAGLIGFTVSNLKIPGYEQPWEHDYGKPELIASPLTIMTDAPIGSASYNNEFGRPSLCGYFRTFEARVKCANGYEVRGYHKPIMLAGGIGNIKEEHVEKGKIPVGGKLIVLGGPAMQIGLGGGAASSRATGDSQKELDFASVQRDNPEMQRRCQEVIDRCWQQGSKNPIAFIHDVGAGGLSNAMTELVSDGDRGGHFQLRAINNDEPGMSPMALWCNEAQERYVLAVAEADLNRFEMICQQERCPYAVVGQATENKQLLLDDSYFRNQPVNIPLDVILGQPPQMQRDFQRQSFDLSPLDFGGVELLEAMERVLKLPSVASKNFLITIGDRTITGLVHRDQMVGPWQTPVSDCAVTVTGFKDYTGEAMAIGERTPIALIDAPASGRMAIGEAITNIAAACIGKIGDIKLSANWMVAAGHPGEDEKLFETVKTVGLDLCPSLGIAIPVGKDSMSMRTRWQEKDEVKSVTSPLSLIISAFAPVRNIRKTLTPQLITDQGVTDLLLIDLGRDHNRLGGSALAQVYGQIGDTVPNVQSPEDLKRFFSVIQELNKQDLILAYHDRSDGGLFTTLVEMAFSGHTGLSVDLDKLAGNESMVLTALFNEELGAVIQIRRGDKGRVKDTLALYGLAACSHTIGVLTSDQRISFRFNGLELVSESRIKFQRWWAETSYRMQAIRDNPECARQEYDNLFDESDGGLHASLPYDIALDVAAPYINTGICPSVAILREQGSNGQVEMAAAFDRAGFETVDVHMTDIIAGRRHLEAFKGLIACGGFSYGDVLGAGEGWAKSILFNGFLRDQFARFFERPDSFSLGVCNGCQMFSHLRELIPGADCWPHFVRNESEQFEARLVMVEVQKSRSIFFHDMERARMPIAVAHGEGYALFASRDYVKHLSDNQQISLKFVDNQGNPTTRYPYNPNGSVYGITGLTSEDGRVTIMMPHPERVFRTVQHSWHPNGWNDDAPLMRVFRNARVWVG